MKTKDKIKIKVDFYADDFWSGIIEVPKDLENYNEEIRRSYVTKELLKRLPQYRNWNFSDVKIIIAKKILE